MTTRRPRAAIVAASGVLCLLLAGCGAEERTVEITDVRERKDAGPAAPDASTLERFRFARDAQQLLERDTETAPPKAAWQFTTPAGWTETGGGEFREMGWTLASSRDAAASFSLAKGGVLANLNRWRGQMGLAPVDAAALAQLEKRPFLGEEALFVELAGTFSGGSMSGPAKPIENAKMLGLIVEIRGTSAFLKLTGPAAAVDAEKEAFLALAQSIRPAPRKDPHAAPPPADTAPPKDRAAGTGPFRWTAPEGWTQQPDRAMRIATYRPAGAKEAEVVISQFPGAAGGLSENLKRWRSQMGLQPLSEAEIAALPRGKALGRTAVFLSMDGDYGGMDGTAGKKGWTFLGAVVEGPEQSVFVKMVGPTGEVRPEEARFREFVESLRE
jgi:hypothetical protein